MAKENAAPKKKGSLKTKVIVGILCALFAIGLLTFMGYGYPQVFGVLASIFCVLSSHEILGVTGCKNKVLTVLAMIFSAAVPAYYTFELDKVIPVPVSYILFFYILLVILIMLKMFDKTRFENVAAALFSSIFIPYAGVSVVLLYQFMETRNDLFCRSNTIFVILITLFAAWLCDSFALFTGRAFGKHKLAPKISPNKSVEGAVGGIIGTTLVSLITFAICKHFYFSTETIKWWMVLIYEPFVCLMGIFGDLAASVIKRNYGVKDFGTLIPEHGGAMDRIDSYLLAMPAGYFIVKIVIDIFA